MNTRARALQFNTKSSTCYTKFRGRRRFRRGVNFCQTSSVFSNPLDLLDHPLLRDIGAPQLRTELGFLFVFKVSFYETPYRPHFSELNDRTMDSV